MSSGDFQSAAELFERAGEEDSAASAWIQAGNWIRAAELYLRHSPKKAAWCVEAGQGVELGAARALSGHSTPVLGHVLTCLTCCRPFRQATKVIHRPREVEVRHELCEDLPAEKALERLPQDGRAHRLDRNCLPNSCEILALKPWSQPNSWRLPGRCAAFWTRRQGRRMRRSPPQSPAAGFSSWPARLQPRRVASPSRRAPVPSWRLSAGDR